MCNKLQLGLAHRTAGGAPDNVRCARLVRGELAALGIRRWRMTIIHRTIRWCTGLSGDPTVASAKVSHAIRGRRVARSNGRLGTPDCPVRQPALRSNGRMCLIWKEIAHSGCLVVHRTVRCTTRQIGRAHV